MKRAGTRLRGVTHNTQPTDGPVMTARLDRNQSVDLQLLGLMCNSKKCIRVTPCGLKDGDLLLRSMHLARHLRDRNTLEKSIAPRGKRMHLLL